MAFRKIPMEAGERDRIVLIQQRTAADPVDASGAPDPTAGWTTLVAQMPAARSDLSGWEQFRSNQMSARADTRWEINYRADMDPTLVDVPKLRRLLVSSRVHDITYASVIGRNEGIELVTLARSG